MAWDATDPLAGGWRDEARGGVSGPLAKEARDAAHDVDAVGRAAWRQSRIGGFDARSREMRCGTLGATVGKMGVRLWMGMRC